jgi:hypothetical protein
METGCFADRDNWATAAGYRNEFRTNQSVARFWPVRIQKHSRRMFLPYQQGSLHVALRNQALPHILSPKRKYHQLKCIQHSVGFTRDESPASA